MNQRTVCSNVRGYFLNAKGYPLQSEPQVLHLFFHSISNGSRFQRPYFGKRLQIWVSCLCFHSLSLGNCNPSCLGFSHWLGTWTFWCVGSRAAKTLLSQGCEGSGIRLSAFKPELYPGLTAQYYLEQVTSPKCLRFLIWKWGWKLCLPPQTLKIKWGNTYTHYSSG